MRLPSLFFASPSSPISAHIASKLLAICAASFLDISSMNSMASKPKEDPTTTFQGSAVLGSPCIDVLGCTGIVIPLFATARTVGGAFSDEAISMRRDKVRLIPGQAQLSRQPGSCHHEVGAPLITYRWAPIVGEPQEVRIRRAIARNAINIRSIYEDACKVHVPLVSFRQEGTCIPVNCQFVEMHIHLGWNSVLCLFAIGH